MAKEMMFGKHLQTNGLENSKMATSPSVVENSMIHEASNEC